MGSLCTDGGNRIHDSRSMLSAICWIPIAGARAVVEGRQSSILSAQ
jgi:hypothetical protein